MSKSRCFGNLVKKCEKAAFSHFCLSGHFGHFGPEKRAKSENSVHFEQNNGHFEQKMAIILTRNGL